MYSTPVLCLPLLLLCITWPAHRAPEGCMQHAWHRSEHAWDPQRMGRMVGRCKHCVAQHAFAHQADCCADMRTAPYLTQSCYQLPFCMLPMQMVTSPRCKPWRALDVTFDATKVARYASTIKTLRTAHQHVACLAAIQLGHNRLSPHYLQLLHSPLPQALHRIYRQRSCFPEAILCPAQYIPA